MVVPCEELLVTDAAVSTRAGLLRDILAEGAVHAVYQPIVHLQTDEVVAYEALARGPAGSPLASPGALFAVARAAGLEPELEFACRAAALRGALSADLAPRTTLFVNVEPAYLGLPLPEELAALLETAATRLRVVVEFSERRLAHDPAALLRTVRAARELHWGLAMDDIGVEPESLSLLGLVRPDVLKIDRSIVAGEASALVRGRVLNAVANASHMTGATVLAEGLETEEDRTWAVSMGVELGQGWLLGRPGPLPVAGGTGRSREVVRLLPAAPAPAAPTPYDLVERWGGSLRRATKGDLLAISMDIEQLAAHSHIQPVLLSAFQDADHFTPATARRYADLTESCALVVALGVGMASQPVEGVRGGDLAADHPLADEWTVVVISPYLAVALIARDVGDDGPDRDRRFDYVITHDRAVVRSAAEILVRHVAAGLGPAQIATV